MLTLALAISLAAYAVIVLFASYMTWREHQVRAPKPLPLQAASYLLCLIWPVTVLGMALFAWRHPAQFSRAEME